EGVRDGRAGRGALDCLVRRDDRTILSGDDRVRQARIQGIRDLHADRRGDEPVRWRVAVRRSPRAGDVDGPPHREGDPDCSETRTPGGHPQLRESRAGYHEIIPEKRGKRFYGFAQHARPTMADDAVTVAVVLLLVSLGIATFLETRYLRKKMKNRRVRTAKRD